MNVIGQNWFNENSNRAYPLAATASGVDDRGQALPQSMLVDISVSVPAAYASGLRVANLNISRVLVSIVLSCASGPVFVGTYLKTGAVEKSLALVPVVDGAAGVVAFGGFIADSTPCAFTFSTATQSALEAAAVTVFGGDGVSGILRQGNATSTAAKGDVILSGSDDLLIANSESDPSALEVAMTPSAAAELYAATASPSRCRTPPIRSINGVTADSDGRILIRFL